MTNKNNQLNRIKELLTELLEIQRASTSEAVLERIDERKEKRRIIYIEDGLTKEVEVDAGKFKEIEDRANSMLQDVPDDAIILELLEHRGKTRYEAFGTGEHAENNDGRKGGWVYYDEQREEFLFKTAR